MGHVITYGVVSEIGLKKKINQDRILIKIGQIGTKEFGLFAVADGMGGHSHGEVASTMAVAQLIDWWDYSLEDMLMTNATPWNQLKSSLAMRFNKINDLIRTATMDKMGTTLTVLLIYGDKYVITHIGDSRIYSKTKQQLNLLTKDHALSSAQDFSDKEQGHVLTQCLGIQEQVHPYTRVSPYHQKQVFLLCSDGLYNYISHPILERIIYQGIRKKKDLQEITQQLYHEVMKQGAGDNVSIMLVQ